MADIIVRNSADGAPYAKALALQLRSDGWSVVLSEDENGTPRSAEDVRRDLVSAKCVLLLWTSQSVKSEDLFSEVVDLAAAKVIVLELHTTPVIQRLQNVERISFLWKPSADRFGIVPTVADISKLPGTAKLKAALDGRGVPHSTWRRRKIRRAAAISASLFAGVVLILSVRAVNLRLRKSGSFGNAEAALGRSVFVGGEREGANRVIVFVHGVLGDSRATWTDGAGYYWPGLVRDDADFKDASVFVVEYQTALLDSALDVDDLAGYLKSLMTANHIFGRYDSVVFVCHSMGGLVVRKFLLKYQQQTFYKKVAMIYFLGTPGAGSGLANFVPLFRTKNPQFNDMATWLSISTVKTIASDWQAAGFGLRSYCAYETLQTDSVTVVDRDSANVGCNQPSEAIVANHSDLAKSAQSRQAFKNAYNQTFGQVATPIQAR